MKKRCLVIISLVMVLVLLCGCASVTEQVATSFVIERETPVPLEKIPFDEIEYVRPDIDSMYAVVDSLHEALNNPLKYNEIAPLMDEFFRLDSEFATMYVLANIRSSLDENDEFYDEEYSWCMENEAELQMLMQELGIACANSVHSQSLEYLYFWDGFVEEILEPAEDESNGTYEDYINIVAQRTELLARYRDMAADLSVALIEINQKVDEYVQQGRYDEALAAYYGFGEEYSPAFSEIYIELMKLNNEEARLMGYESYAQLQYEYEFSRDYSPEEAKEYLGHIKNYVSKLGLDVLQAGLADKLFYDPLYERDLKLYLETLADDLGGAIEEAYELMIEYRMYDFSLDTNKAETSFQSYLTDYEIPYLFLYPYGDTGDLVTLCHEFGHYADSYIRKGADESIDLAEVYSQAMQLMSFKPLRVVMREEARQNYRLMTMLDLLSAMQSQAALAEFELRAYEMEEPTMEKLNDLYAQLLLEYGIELEEDAESLAPSWITVSHLFESPFYVISYCVSAAVALELYEAELENEGSGIEQFIRMSESQIPGLMEAVEYAELSNPLLESSVQHTADFLRSQLLE